MLRVAFGVLCIVLAACGQEAPRGGETPDGEGGAGGGGGTGGEACELAPREGAFVLPGANGGETAGLSVVERDGVVYLGGTFESLGTRPARNVGAWTEAEGWSPLGDGLEGMVRSLAVAPDGIVWASWVPPRADPSAGPHRLSRWDGEAWQDVASTEAGTIEALAVDRNGSLYAAGTFLRIGGQQLPYLARYDGDAWSALESPPTGPVFALLLEDAGLCAGGAFDRIGETPAWNVACWDGASWSAMDLPPPDDWSTSAVLALARDPSGALLAGGHFDLEAFPGESGGSIARWNGAGWEPIGDGLLYSPFEGVAVPGIVTGLAQREDGLYVAGTFARAGGQQGIRVHSVARWNGEVWEDVGGVSLDVPGLAHQHVVAMADVGDGDLILAGTFSALGDSTASAVGRRSGDDWLPLANPDDVTLGVEGMVQALLADGCGIYAGGTFRRIDGADVGYVARWNGSRWSALGSGLDMPVAALAHLPDGELIAAAGNDWESQVSVWRDGAWEQLGGRFDGDVTELAVAEDGTIYAGGGFVAAGGIPVRNLAVWEDSHWAELGGGFGDRVSALLIDGAEGLVVGGWIEGEGGFPEVAIARWDGEGWSGFGEGLRGSVLSLVEYEGRLLAGGAPLVAGNDERGFLLAAWDGERWEELALPLRDGIGCAMHALAVHEGRLLAAGRFSFGDRLEEGSLVVWTGDGWELLGELDRGPWAIAAGEDGVWLGGAFTEAGGVPSVGIARFDVPAVRSIEPASRRPTP